MRNILSAIAGILFLIGFIPYIREILKGVAKPSKASWIIWTTLDLVVIAGMWAKHSLNGQIIGAFSGSVITTILALKYGKPGWTWVDKTCLAGGALGIVLWRAFDDADIGIAIGMAIVMLGTIPTIVSAWKNPAHESRMAWTIFFVSCIFAIGAIPAWTVADALQPLVYLTGESVMVLILYIGPWVREKSEVHEQQHESPYR